MKDSKNNTKRKHNDEHNQTQDKSIESKNDLLSAFYHCDSCQSNLKSVRIECAVCEDFDLCVPCFTHGEPQTFPIYEKDWGADEELLLLEGISKNGLDNWEDISYYIGSKTKQECKEHYEKIYVESNNWPLPKEMIDKIDTLIDTSKMRKFIKSKKNKIDNNINNKKKQKTNSNKNQFQSFPSNHEILGYMPGRLEFETEMENEAENNIKEIEFDEENDTATEIDAHLLKRKCNILRLYLENNVSNLYEGAVLELNEPKKFKAISPQLIPLPKPLKANTSKEIKIPENIITAQQELLTNSNQENNNKTIGRKAGTRVNYLAGPLDISSANGFDLLSNEEKNLCSILRLLPKAYLVIKETLIAYYLKNGSLKRRHTRNLIKIDVNKTGRLYDFFFRMGWVKP